MRLIADVGADILDLAETMIMSSSLQYEPVSVTRNLRPSETVKALENVFLLFYNNFSAHTSLCGGMVCDFERLTVASVCGSGFSGLIFF